MNSDLSLAGDTDAPAGTETGEGFLLTSPSSVAGALDEEIRDTWENYRVAQAQGWHTSVMWHRIQLRALFRVRHRIRKAAA